MLSAFFPVCTKSTLRGAINSLLNEVGPEKQSTSARFRQLIICKDNLFNHLLLMRDKACPAHVLTMCEVKRS